MKCNCEIYMRFESHSRCGQRLSASIAALAALMMLWQQNAIYVIPNGVHGFRPAEDSPVWNIADWTLDAARQ